MANSTYFVQECPTCGRRLQIRVEYLGKRLQCQHCQGQLIAADPANGRLGAAVPGDALLRRADQLLDSVERRSQRCHPR
jgi:DNA-directed RNA polymerase subunit RPC12/RpoP